MSWRRQSRRPVLGGISLGGVSLGALVCACALSTVPAAAAVPVLGTAPDCLIRLTHAPAPRRFAQFAARPERSRPPAPPLLSTAQARRFRTVLREGAAAGPNFAGHFTVVAWRCGASCTEAAIPDARTGRVRFPEALHSISAVHVADLPGAGYGSLRFQRDSRLLVVLGAPGEDEARDGVADLEWTGTALRLLRFVPRSQSCPG